MRLLYSPASPFARKVLVAAHELGLADRIQPDNVGASPVVASAEVNAQNPLGKIPALVLDDGGSLYDSGVICEYLDEMGGRRLIPAEPGRRWTVLRRHALADGLTEAALLARYESVLRPEPLRWPDWLAGQKQKIARALDQLAAEVESFPQAPDLGTIATACALGYLDYRFADEPWRDGRPALARWFASFAERPSMVATRPG
jgi:glutathione S-transferase